MTITLSADLESALKAVASRLGMAPEDLAINSLRERFVSSAQPIQPRDEWERRLLGAASDCGVALSHEAVSSEGLYD